MHKLLDKCPSCGDKMIVTEMSCSSCETVVRGQYTGSIFDQLSDEDQRFLAIFVGCRGNVKEMERETGLGYWTIRGRLDDLINVLQLGAKTTGREDIKAQRRDILAAVEGGELSVAEAEQQLSRLGKRR